jgi:hypothetical protein
MNYSTLDNMTSFSDLGKLSNKSNYNEFEYNMNQTNNKKEQNESNQRTALKGFYRCNEKTNNDPLSTMFFSAENIKRIQKKIRNEITNRTNGVFRLDVDQDDAAILLAMRAVFLEEGRFLPTRIIHQVKTLNQHVIDQIIPNMITEIKQEYGYIKEINEPLKPIMRPMNVSAAGRKTLPSITSVWGL